MKPDFIVISVLLLIMLGSCVKQFIPQTTEKNFRTGRDYVEKYPLNYIAETSDRLEVKYSILANQYSLSPDEYTYWDKLKSMSDDVGGLYDIVPANVPGNITCITHPEERVLGYFSVSAKASRRIFIKDYFAGQVNIYSSCASEKVTNPGIIPGVGFYVWILERNDYSHPPYVILTSDKGCVDCTLTVGLLLIGNSLFCSLQLKINFVTIERF